METTLIVLSDLDDDDLNKAADLAIMGTKNSGQRCTAVKRILVQESVVDKFVELALEKAKSINLVIRWILTISWAQ